MRKKLKLVLAVALACSAVSSPAFQTIEDVQWPDKGRFPAYPPEPPDGHNVRFSVFGGVLYDNNVFRLSDGVDPQPIIGTTNRADTIGRYGAGLKADIPVSQQHFRLDAQVERLDFSRFDVLDHTAYRADAAWKWAAGPQWGGEIGYGKRRFLASLAELQTLTKDLVTEDHAYAGAGFRFTPRWRVRAGLDSFEWDHSDPTQTTLNNRTNAGTVGLDYVTPGENSVGLQFKYSEGDYPNRQVVAGSTVDNNFKEYESSAVAHWIVTGKSVLDARLGYSMRRHDQLPQRDFDGMTGKLSYDWFVAPKTVLNFAAWREIRSIEDVSASYVLSHGWGFGPAWAPTSKLVFQAKYVRDYRDYQGDPGFVLTGAPQREDRFRGIYLAAGYAPLRNVQLSLGVERGVRDSNIFGKNYDYEAVMANVRAQF